MATALELEKAIEKAGKKLTKQMKDFVAYLMATENLDKKAAYMKAYPKSTALAAESSATRLYQIPKVTAYIELCMNARSLRTNIDADWVLNQAVKVHERCMQARPVLDREGEQVYVETPDGEQKPAFTFEHSGANKSLEMIGKHVSVQAFNEKSTTTHNIITDDGGNEW